MSDTKSTGWKAEADEKGSWFVLAEKRVGSAEDIAAICATNGYGEREARLIAAAPDLLVALVACVSVMSHELHGLTVIQPELRKAQAALAKAGAV